MQEYELGTKLLAGTLMAAGSLKLFANFCAYYVTNRGIKYQGCEPELYEKFISDLDPLQDWLAGDGMRLAIERGKRRTARK